jgi:hypothetical protein
LPFTFYVLIIYYVIEYSGVVMCILTKIEMLREQLHTLITEDANYDVIVDKSVELDVLISSYYNISSSK